jgi:hypothetical protein
MGTVTLLSDIASYGFAIVPLVIFVLWTWFGNWWTYDLGRLIMTLDMGLWAVDWPSTARHIWHLNTFTNGWKIYFVIAEWIVLVAMTWRGYIVLREVYLKRHEKEVVANVPEDVRS